MLLFVIKISHSLIIIYMMVCLYAIWHYALLGIYMPFVKCALLSILLEGIVFIAWGFECPLTIWAMHLGDDTGADLLSEIFYLEQVEYTNNFIIFFIVGAMLSIRRYVIQNRR